MATGIEIFTGLVSLFKGETEQLSWQVLPVESSNQEVIFEVANPAICSISKEGLITATGNGKTIVTVRSVENKNITSTFYVSSVVRVETIHVDVSSLQMSKGDTLMLKVTVLPEDATDKRLIWETWNWNSPYISIDPNTNRITASADGEETIIITSASNYNAQVQIPVRIWTEVQDIVILPERAEMGINQVNNLNYYISPNDASNTDVIIAVDNEDILSYENGQLIGRAAGEATVTVTSKDNPDVSSSYRIAVYDTRESTVEDYNAADRIIQWKAEIYFDGITQEPLVITRDNYLIDMSLLEETHSDNSSPFGSVTANEIDLKLWNTGGIFSPTKRTSPYYGKIKKDVPIRVFCRPSDQDYIDWDEMGWFYVTDWVATITGSTATVTASDKMYKLFDKPSPRLTVLKDVSFAAAYQLFFDALQEPVTVDGTLTERLPYFYNVKNNKEFLTEISTGAQAYVFCSRNGQPSVRYARGSQGVKYTLTDGDQIKGISSKQSAVLEYNGTSVILNKPQESVITPLLSIGELEVNTDRYVSAPTMFKNVPVYRLISSRITGALNVGLDNVIASCVDVIYTLYNNNEEAKTIAFELLGTFIEIISTNISDEGDNLLEVNNVYIQTESYAQKFKRFLQAYVTSAVPVLELEVRGNPKYLLGDKVRAISQLYEVDFTGIIIRQNFQYNGGMSCSMSLLNSDIVEVI